MVSVSHKLNWRSWLCGRYTIGEHEVETHYADQHDNQTENAHLDSVPIQFFLNLIYVPHLFAPYFVLFLTDFVDLSVPGSELCYEIYLHLSLIPKRLFPDNFVDIFFLVNNIIDLEAQLGNLFPLVVGHLVGQLIASVDTLALLLVQNNNLFQNIFNGQDRMFVIFQHVDEKELMPRDVKILI
jgi:hypothetical protein